MGLYYTPNPPHIGGAQPLEGKKLTPPAGPVPQNPPFNGGRINPAILGCWAAAVVAAAILPTLPENLTPPSAAAAPQTGVIFDSKSVAVATGLGLQTFTDSSSLTVANNPNRALILTINLSGSPSGFTASWDGVAMVQLGLITQSTFDDTTVMFGLRNPNIGTKALTASWSGTSDFSASAVSFYNVDQTSDAAAFKNVTTAQGTTSPASVTVTSLGNGDKVVATHTLGAFTTFSAVNNTLLYNSQVNSISGAGNRAITSISPSVTMTATESANQPWTSIGVAVQPVRTLPARWPQEATIAAWIPPAPMPIVGPNRTPPSGPVGFPFRGSSVPTEVLVSWLPPAFSPPIVQELLIPPIAGPPLQNPPFMGGAKIQQAILNAWIPPPPMPIVADNLVPPIAGPVASNPPFNGGAQVPQAVLNAWIPPPPAPIVAVLSDSPVSGPVSQNPPFMGGAEIPQAILNAWIPPPWIPVVAVNLTPPSAPVAAFVPPTRFPAEILNAWQLPPFAIITAENLTPPSGPVTTFPPLGSFVPREVLISWIPPDPAPIVARNLVPPISGPVADNPPFIGALVPVALPADWVPIVARNLTPPSAAVITFTPPARFLSEILSAWQVAAPITIVAQNLTPPSGPVPYVPVGARVAVEILNAWVSSPPAPIVAINLTPPTPTVPSGLPVGGGARVPGEVLINWLPPAPMPVLARNLTPPSGPTADNPPFNGGTRLRLEIQLNWLAAQPGYPPLKAINKIPPSGPINVTVAIHANPFLVTFGLRPL